MIHYNCLLFYQYPLTFSSFLFDLSAYSGENFTLNEDMFNFQFHFKHDNETNGGISFQICRHLYDSSFLCVLHPARRRACRFCRKLPPSAERIHQSTSPVTARPFQRPIRYTTSASMHPASQETSSETNSISHLPWGRSALFVALTST